MDYPMYVVYYNGNETGEENEWSDVQHAIEVGSFIGWANYFGHLFNVPDSSLENKSKSL